MTRNSPSLATKLANTENELPLGVVTREFDGNLHKIPANAPLHFELRDDLPDDFRRFAHFIDKEVAPTTMSPQKQPTVKLYRDIYDRWITKYVVRNDNASGLLAYELKFDLGTGPPAKSDLLTTPLLLQAFKKTHTVVDEDLHFMYVGLYMFAVWTFLERSALVGQHPKVAVLNDVVKRYVTRECIKWRHDGVKIDASYFIDKSGPTPEYRGSFLRGFSVTDRLIDMLNTTGNGLDPNSFDDPRTNIEIKSLGWKLAEHFKGGSEAARAQASLEFFRFFRSTLIRILDEDYLDLLGLIDAGMLEKGRKLTQFAVGNGEDTLGVFNKQDFGTLFWDYELVRKESGIVPDDRIHTSHVWERDVTVVPPTIFIAQWGGQNQRTLDVITQTDTSTATDSLSLALPIGAPPGRYNSYLAPATTNGWWYDSNHGMLSFSDDTICDVRLRAASGDALALLEDLVYLSFPNSLGQPLGGPPPTERLAFHQLFDDNEFVVDFSTLWRTPADEAMTRTIVLKLRDNWDFGLNATRLSGGGVGRSIESPPDFGSKLASDPDQWDSDDASPGDEYRRYGYGEIAWRPKLGLSENVLEFIAVGFTSSVRCTWATWSFFQEPVTGSTSGETKAAELKIDIGQHLRHEKWEPDEPAKPSYNTVLSAFRAMGMFEAMVRRLQSRADELVPTDLTHDQRTDIKDELEAFLNFVRIPVKQYLRDADTGIQLGYSISYPTPDTIYFTKYAY